MRVIYCMNSKLKNTAALTIIGLLKGNRCLTVQDTTMEDIGNPLSKILLHLVLHCLNPCNLLQFNTLLLICLQLFAFMGAHM